MGLMHKSDFVQWDDGTGNGIGLREIATIMAQQALTLDQIKTAVTGPEITTLTAIEADMRTIGSGLAVAGGMMGGGSGNITNASYEAGDGSGVGGIGGGSGKVPGTGKGVGHFFSSAVREANLKHWAAVSGINPSVAMKVALSEGFNKFSGDQNRSFGDFQMFTGGGLGNLYRKLTGKNPADPRNELDLDRFAMSQAAKDGWGAWHGARKLGITGHASMGYKGPIPPKPDVDSIVSGSGVGSTHHGDNVFHIHGSDPHAVANEVQRRMDGQFRYRTHDVDFDV